MSVLVGLSSPCPWPAPMLLFPGRSSPFSAAGQWSQDCCAPSPAGLAEQPLPCDQGQGARGGHSGSPRAAAAAFGGHIRVGLGALGTRQEGLESWVLLGLLAQRPRSALFPAVSLPCGWDPGPKSCLSSPRPFSALPGPAGPAETCTCPVLVWPLPPLTGGS